MKKIIALAALAATCSTSAFAQVSNFTGPSVGANIDFKSTTLKFSDSGTEFSGLGKQNTIASVSADYGFKLDSSAVILVGGKFDLGKTTIASVSGSSGSASLIEKNHYSVFVAPGLLLSDKTLAYGKLSIESAKGAVECASGCTDTATIHGVGYGVGIRTHITGNWYLNVEAGRIDYSAKSLGTASATTGTSFGSFGASYKF